MTQDAPRLASYVHVTDAEGRAHVFAPGGDVPDWAVALITNERAWEVPPAIGGELANASWVGEDVPGLVVPPVGRTVDTITVDLGPKAPNRTGPGSGRGEWLKYCQVRGIEVRQGASRDEMIAAVDAADEE